MPTKTSEPERKPWIEAADIAAEIGVPLATVYLWNHKGTGPRFYRLGRHVRYRRADVDAWLEEHAQTQGPPS